MLEATRSALPGVVRGIGRVEPEHPTAHDYFGTVWLVDTGAGLMLTNPHVVEAMRRWFPQHIELTERGMRVPAGVFVDFVGEFGARKDNRFRLVETVTSPTADGPEFHRLDAAVLRLDPTLKSKAGFPLAIGVATRVEDPQGNLSSYCLMEFSDAHHHFGGRHKGVDWTWVHTTLFSHRYGSKCLTRGTTHRPLVSVDDDERQWIFEHDLTTLGGNPGSPIVDWPNPKPHEFGLHFAEAILESNFAHALGACATELEAFGVPVG